MEQLRWRHFVSAIMQAKVWIATDVTSTRCNTSMLYNPTASVKLSGIQLRLGRFLTPVGCMTKHGLCSMDAGFSDNYY